MQCDIAGHDQRPLGVVQLLQIGAILQWLLDHLDAAVAPFGAVERVTDIAYDLIS